MLTDQPNLDKKVLSSNRKIVNSAITPPKIQSNGNFPVYSDLSHKENLHQQEGFPQKNDKILEIEEKYKKYEEEIQRNKFNEEEIVMYVP